MNPRCPHWKHHESQLSYKAFGTQKKTKNKKQKQKQKNKTKNKNKIVCWAIFKKKIINLDDCQMYKKTTITTTIKSKSQNFGQQWNLNRLIRVSHIFFFAILSYLKPYSLSPPSLTCSSLLPLVMIF